MLHAIVGVAVLWLHSPMRLLSLADKRIRGTDKRRMNLARGVLIHGLNGFLAFGFPLCMLYPWSQSGTGSASGVVFIFFFVPISLALVVWAAAQLRGIKKGRTDDAGHRSVPAETE
jgi:hypothetical protein